MSIILSGTAEGDQLPQFGNKVLGCYNCTMDIHGLNRNASWAELDSSYLAGVNSITLSSAVDWAVGEEIVIASSSYNHN